MDVCVCVYTVFVLSCVQVAALRRVDPLPRSPTDCLIDQETEKAAKAQRKPVETWIGTAYCNTDNDRNQIPAENVKFCM
jgi:hypothetical protein